MAFNMEDLLKGKNGVTDITLQPNDILFIQTRNQSQEHRRHPGSIGSVGLSRHILARILGL